MARKVQNWAEGRLLISIINDSYFKYLLFPISAVMKDLKTQALNLMEVGNKDFFENCRLDSRKWLHPQKGMYWKHPPELHKL